MFEAATGAAYLLAALPGTRILVVGDVMLDRYQWGEVDRVSPEAPVPVVTMSSCSERWGGAALAAGVANGLGAIVEVVGVLGDDAEGDRLRKVIACAGIGATLVVDPGRRTTVKTRIYARGQQLLRLDSETSTPLSPATVARLVSACMDAVQRCDAVLVSDYGKGACSDEVLRAVVAAARRLGRPVVVDPKSEPVERYAGATVVTPNLKELGILARMPVAPGDAEAIEVAARSVRWNASCDSVLVTLGASGMALVGDGIDWVSAVAQEVYDVSGAGDAVAATIAAGLGAGGATVTAACLASIVAGVVIRKVGASSASLDEVEAALATARV